MFTAVTKPGGRKPPHEVMSGHLTMALAGIAGTSGRVHEAEAIMLFGMLQESGMSPDEARGIAQKHRGDPEVLRKAGMKHLAQWAESVIADLNGRCNEPKTN